MEFMVEGRLALLNRFMFQGERRGGITTKGAILLRVVLKV